MNLALFRNPESTAVESGIEETGSGILSVESKVQDCHGRPRILIAVIRLI